MSRRRLLLHPSDLAIARPRLVLLAALLVVALVAPGVTRLRVRTDGNALIPQNEPLVVGDRRIRDAFGLRDALVLVVRTGRPDGIYAVEPLRLVHELTRAVAALPDVSRDEISSLATEPSDHVRPGTVTPLTFLEPIPATPEQCAALRDDLRAIGIWTGTLVSPDGSATCVILDVPPAADRAALHRAATAIARARETEAIRIDVVGAPVAESLLGRHLLEDLGVQWLLDLATGTPAPAARDREAPGAARLLRRVGLLPLALAVMAAVFLVAFRRPAAALLPLGEVGLCLAIVFGTMGWLGVPIYLTIAVMPVVLTAVGVADEIHVLGAYRRRLGPREPADRAAVVRATMDELRGPIVKTSLTTAIGLASFGVSPLAPVRAFGWCTALGVLTCLAISLLVVPAVLVLVPSRWLATGRDRPWRWLDAVAGLAIRRRTLVVAAAAAVAVAAALGAPRVVVQDSWIDGFAPSSPFRRATGRTNELFLGTHLLRIHVDGRAPAIVGETRSDRLGRHALAVPDPPEGVRPEPGWWVEVAVPESDRPARLARVVAVREAAGELVVETDPLDGSIRILFGAGETGTVRYRVSRRPLLEPEVLHALCRFSARIEAREGDAVGGVLGPCAYLRTTSYLFHGRDADEHRVPPEPRRILTMWRQYDRVRGERRRHQLVAEHHDAAIVTVYLEAANYVATARLLRAIDGFAREELAPHGISIELAGDVAVSQSLIRAIVTTQVRALALSLVGVLAVSIVLTRSLRTGVLCVLPCALAVLANYAVMGVAGVPLGVATSMFAVMILGIGVDFAIHLTDRWRRLRAAGAAAPFAARDAVRAVGPAVVVDAAALALGFGVLTLSTVPANARLGALLALSAASCLAATLLVLPALLAGRRSRIL